MVRKPATNLPLSAIIRHQIRHFSIFVHAQKWQVWRIVAGFLGYQPWGNQEDQQRKNPYNADNRENLPHLPPFDLEPRDE